MHSVLVRGEVPPSDLAGLFVAVGAEGQGAVGYAYGNVRIVLYVGRKFFFRSNDYLGLVILASTDGASQRIDISYAGGGSGLLGVQWGAGDSLETSLFDALLNVLRARSLAYGDPGSPGPGGGNPLP